MQLDKYFQILLQVFKKRYASNYIRHLEKFSKNTGLVIRNNAFAIRTVEFTDDELEEIRKDELIAYNMEFMKDYHFIISEETHKNFFKDENFDEIVGTYYIYILHSDSFVRNRTKVFYEICMASSRIKDIKKTTKKKDENAEQKEKYVFEVKKQNTKIETIEVSSWEQVPEKCKLFKFFVEGERRMHHNELFTLCTSLMYIVGGEKRFIDTINRYPQLYDRDKDKRWKDTFDYCKRQCYNPTSCNLYCPFAGECTHLPNMRDTVAPRNVIYPLKNIEYIELSVIEQQLFFEIKKFYDEGEAWLDE